jgi:hypothetical protein
MRQDAVRRCNASNEIVAATSKSSSELIENNTMEKYTKCTTNKHLWKRNKFEKALISGASAHGLPAFPVPVSTPC